MFFGSHKMKMSHYFFSLWYPLELGTFLISPNFELFPTETWDFFDFLTTPPTPPIWTVSQISPLFSLEIFPQQGCQSLQVVIPSLFSQLSYIIASYYLHLHFGPFPKFPRFLVWKPSLKSIRLTKYWAVCRQGGGGHHHFGPFPKFPRFLLWKASLKVFV